MKKDYAEKKRYLIETDLGYIPKTDVSRLRTDKKPRKLLMYLLIIRFVSEQDCRLEVKFSLNIA